jgi:hypothetical protein
MKVPVRILEPFNRSTPFGSRLRDVQLWMLLLLVTCSGVGAAEGERDTNSTHWSLQPLRPVQPLKTRQQKWGLTPIDSFILATLKTKGMAPNPPADKRTLLRRATFDLTGLPPTPEELRAFLGDKSSKSFEKVVDRLLASPRYGERWARHWMDVVHFAETHGNDQDRIRTNAWPYRDYLIRSFNEDKPYARFVREQLAGDVLFSDDPQATVALGFIAAGPWDESSLRDIREDTIDRQIGRYLDRDDMVMTTMSTFASATVHCARCHDHKFDPISQEDYYSLQAVFAGVDRAERVFDADPKVHAARQQLLKQRRALERKDTALMAALLEPAMQGEVAEWEKSAATSVVSWTVLEPVSFVSSNGTTLTKQSDGSLIAGGARPEKDTYIITAHSELKEITAVRLEVLSDESLPHKGPGRQDNGNLHLSEFKVFAGLQAGSNHSAHKPQEITQGFKAVHKSPERIPERFESLGEQALFRFLPLQNASADFDQQGWAAAHAIDGQQKTAWGIYPQVGQTHFAVFELKQDAPGSGKDMALRFVLEQNHGSGHLIGRLRLSATTAPRPVRARPLPGNIEKILATASAQRSKVQRSELAAYHLRKQIEQKLAALPKPQLVYAGASDFAPDGGLVPAKAPRTIHMLKRGDINKPGAEALPGALTAVASLQSRFGLASSAEEGSRRAALAEWMVDSKNPLTWRSIVNRVWHYHFGRGIVDSPNDLGKMGGEPSHPELLDWLAGWFIEQGGSFKELHRLIVTSAVYQQSSRDNPAFARIDADNRLLWRMNRSRLDAESVRDAILQITGDLDLTMGGPSVKQFTLGPGIHVTPVVDYAKFDIDSPDNRRRSIYRFLFRTLPDPFMDSLDCPEASQLAPVRGASVTALQALSMLNNHFVTRQSERFAERVTGMKPTLPGQIEAAYELALGRSPSRAEARDLLGYAKKYGLANLCRLIFNSNEFMFVN